MGATRAPVIGVTGFGRVDLTGRRSAIYGVNQTYVQALLAAGATPVIVPPALDSAALSDLLARLDGLLLTGGADIDPTRYGQERLPVCGAIEPERDALELALTEMALARDLPIFGICRGMQTLNVACGGALYQDISAQRPESLSHPQSELPRDHRAHRIVVERDSRLGAILGVDEAEVNSLHHQAVSEPGAGARIVAWASDGVAEGMELPAQRFALAVQYHPEELVASDALSRQLFAAFVAACAE